MEELDVEPGLPVVLNAGPLLPADEMNVTPLSTILLSAWMTRL
jgi:hypothetical protein